MKNDTLILRFVIVKKFYKISPRKIHGAMTLSITTFIIKTLSITTLSIRTQHDDAQHDN